MPPVEAIRLHRPTSTRAVLQVARSFSPRSPHSRDPLVSPPGMSPLGAVAVPPSRSVTGNRMDGLEISPAWTKYTPYGSEHSCARTAPRPRVTPRRANSGKERPTPATSPPRRQRVPPVIAAPLFVAEHGRVDDAAGLPLPSKHRDNSGGGMA